MIRIFTHVGLDPRTGGGVAAYVRNLAAILRASDQRHEILKVSQFSKFLMLIAFFRYFSFRGTILLNSAFHPFSLLMILFSRSKNLIVMPHGEFLSAALELNKRKKQIVLRILKWLTNYCGTSKKVTIVAASKAEANNFMQYIAVRDVKIVQDVVHLPERRIPAKAHLSSRDNRLHVVMIGRMVRMKGFDKVLKDLDRRILPEIEKISVYYLDEDPVYLSEVEDAASRLRSSGMNVLLREGRDADEIYSDCKETNCVLIVPSDFESFGYVLVENLWMPNKPVVSFENELTSYLGGRGHCRLVRDNCFAEAIRTNEPADNLAVCDAIQSYADAINVGTIEILFGADT